MFTGDQPSTAAQPTRPTPESSGHAINSDFDGKTASQPQDIGPSAAANSSSGHEDDCR